MSRVKCVFSRGEKSCSYEFSSDGHSLCVPHRLCVSEDFVYRPDLCVQCSEHVKFFRALGSVDRLSQHFLSIKKSWEAVQRSAKRKRRSASWHDPELREFLLGRPAGRSSLSTTSTGRSSPASSLADASRPSPPPAPLEAVTPPPPPPPGPAAAPVQPSPDVLALLPQLQVFLRDLVADITPAIRASVAAESPSGRAPPPPGPVSAPGSSGAPDFAPALGPRTAPAHASSPGPPAAPSPPPSPPYAVASSPVTSEASDREESSDLLPRGWAPIEDDWEVHQDGDEWVVLRPDSAAHDSLARVPDVHVRWGCSDYSASPAWHFRPRELPPLTSPALPCPSLEDVHSALSTLALLSGLAPPRLAPEGGDASRRAVLLSWMAGQALPFLRPLQDWWPQAASKTQGGLPSRPASRLRAPLLPMGDGWDAQLGHLLLSRPSRSFPPPLSSPSADALRKAERDRAAALESFSGLSSLFCLESLLRQLSASSPRGRRVSAALLCDSLLPLLRSAIYQLAPAASADVGQSLVSLMAVWRQAVAPLPPAAQASLLTADPCSLDFGSPKAVTEALARAPQVAVVYQGQSAPRAPPARARVAAAPRSRPSASSPSVQRRPRQDPRRHPYPPRSSRPSSSAARSGRPPRGPAPPSRRVEERPFRGPSSSTRGARR